MPIGWHERAHALPGREASPMRRLQKHRPGRTLEPLPLSPEVPVVRREEGPPRQLLTQILRGVTVGAMPVRKKALCSEPGCAEEEHSKGYCSMHYARKRRTGSTKRTKAENTVRFSFRVTPQTKEALAKDGTAGARAAELLQKLVKKRGYGKRFSPSADGPPRVTICLMIPRETKAALDAQSILPGARARQILEAWAATPF